MAIFLAPIFFLGLGVGWKIHDSLIGRDENSTKKSSSQLSLSNEDLSSDLSGSFVNISTKNNYKQLTTELKTEIHNPPLLKKTEIKEKECLNDNILSKIKNQMKTRREKIEIN